MSTTPTTAPGNLRPTPPSAVNAGNTSPTNSQTPKQAPAASPKPVGYGLPCANCRTYYAADLHVCPICKTAERMSPLPAPVRAIVEASDPTPDPAALEQERNKFLEEFHAQVLASQSASSPSAAHCTRGENHPQEPEPATVCQSCYDQLQERVDVLEAALHIDMKEATQLIYDAVWAEPTEPEKTYQNAAAALLGELRRRSGVTPTFHAQMPRLD